MTEVTFCETCKGILFVTTDEGLDAVLALEGKSCSCEGELPTVLKEFLDKLFYEEDPQ